MKRTLFVCGMASERALLPPDATVVVSSGRPFYLEQLLSKYSSDMVGEVISFGICGGIDPALKPGDMVLNEPINIYGGLLRTSAEKLRIGANGRFIACDLETGIANNFATKLGVGFGMARFVADPATFTLPPAALIPLKYDGTPNYFAVAESILKNPGQVPALVRLNSYTNTALAALRAWVKKQTGQ